MTGSESGVAPAASEGGESFIAPLAMEGDPEGLFAGDRGVLDADVRRVLVRLLQRRFLVAERSKEEWATLIRHQSTIEARLNDLYVRLVVDHQRGVAYKQQVLSDDGEIPILLRDDAYGRAETLVLVYLRTVYQRESTAGELSIRVDADEIEQTVLTYFAEVDGSTATRQKAIRRALTRLRQEGLIEEESEGRYTVSPMVEIVLSAERLTELVAWLTAPARRLAGAKGAFDAQSDAEGEADAEEAVDEAQRKEPVL